MQYRNSSTSYTQEHIYQVLRGGCFAALDLKDPVPDYTNTCNTCWRLNSSGHTKFYNLFKTGVSYMMFCPFHEFNN